MKSRCMLALCVVPSMAHHSLPPSLIPGNVTLAGGGEGNN